MGRTIPSWRLIVESEIAKLKGYRETLSREDRAVFDDLMNQLRLYASATSAAALPVKTDAIFLTLLFAQHKMLCGLKEKIRELERY